MNPSEILKINQETYISLSENGGAFFRYPDDWLIRFHHMFLKRNIPADSKVLDYGCGSGNNSVFFMQQGFDVYGVDIPPSFKDLVKKNIELNHLDPQQLQNFHALDIQEGKLDFPDNFFDFVFSNQFLYFSPSEAYLKKVSAELSRVLKPNGYAFFTMVGPKNHYITHHVKQVYDDRIYDVRIEDEKHRLNGVRELIFLIKDEEDLAQIFSDFEPVSIGYFDQKMMDLISNFHFIFVGKKN